MRLSAVRLDGLAISIVAMLGATWSVWRWFARRICDGSDEPWGLLALATVAVLAWQRRAVEGWEKRFPWAVLCLAAYGATFLLVPPLIRAGIAATALGTLLFHRRGSAGLWGLLALSLPIVATLQFYAGYPLRVLAAGVSATALRLCGFAVTREGTLLHWAGETVMVDAPCSGIHMLWFGFYLAFLLAAFYRLSARRTLWCAAATLALVVGANVIRATVLFFKEARIVAWPEWTHAGVGIVLFVGAAWLIAAAAQRLQASKCVV